MWLWLWLWFASVVYKTRTCTIRELYSTVCEPYNQLYSSRTVQYSLRTVRAAVRIANCTVQFANWTAVQQRHSVLVVQQSTVILQKFSLTAFHINPYSCISTVLDGNGCYSAIRFGRTNIFLSRIDLYCCICWILDLRMHSVHEQLDQLLLRFWLRHQEW